MARSDVARRHELNQFLGWLLGKHSQAEVTRTATGRILRHRTGWCWNIVPSIPGTGEVHDEVQLDGIYLRGGGCCLIAISGGHVIGWQWCDTEKKAAWVALIERFPAPRVVVIDGGSGLASALKRVWPDTRIQRCLVHAQRNNVRTQITSRTRLETGRRLSALSLALTKISTRHQAVIWLQALDSWHEVNKDLLAERTYRGAGDAPVTFVGPR